MKPSGPELLFVERFSITDSVSFLVANQSVCLGLGRCVFLGIRPALGFQSVGVQLFIVASNHLFYFCGICCNVPCLIFI